MRCSRCVVALPSPIWWPSLCEPVADVPSSELWLAFEDPSWMNLWHSVGVALTKHTDSVIHEYASHCTVFTLVPVDLLFEQCRKTRSIPVVGCYTITRVVLDYTLPPSSFPCYMPSSRSLSLLVKVYSTQTVLTTQTTCTLELSLYRARIPREGRSPTHQTDVPRMHVVL